MPRLKLTKNAIDSLPNPQSDLVYWDAGCAGFGLKVTPKGRKVFIVLYRIAGAGSKLRKYTIGPYGRVTLHQARVAAQKIFTARLEGRDPAAEKRDAKRRIVADRVEDIVETFISQRLSQNRSVGETARLLRRELKPWFGKSIHEIKKRDVVEIVTAVVQRGAPIAASASSRPAAPHGSDARHPRTARPRCRQGIQQLFIALDESLLLRFVELARNDIRLVIFEPQAMQQRDQSRTAFVNEAEFLLDKGADMARRARQRRADKDFQCVFLRGAQKARAPAHVEAGQALDPTLFKEFEPATDRVVVKQQSIGDFLSAPPVVQKHQGVGRRVTINS